MQGFPFFYKSMLSKCPCPRSVNGVTESAHTCHLLTPSAGGQENTLVLTSSDSTADHSQSVSPHSVPPSSVPAPIIAHGSNSRKTWKLTWATEGIPLFRVTTVKAWRGQGRLVSSIWIWLVQLQTCSPSLGFLGLTPCPSNTRAHW